MCSHNLIKTAKLGVTSPIFTSYYSVLTQDKLLWPSRENTGLIARTPLWVVYTNDFT